ncbi:TetR/AcrR family transcriptional regulator [Rhizobium sp. L1K21]|uniref:TetR/AcrR family transcriptional regulator n=1 Tax=Rhizobium sp. L1K21 TaxID=2954933 RepID=UPI002093B41E|nr:TetR/AcrR family transcriptional regulator [Rhizobium sp. L1K21]MCO6186428.1 TetR/AcrR family transcriptional regulator [Rhizobium sp. L1K21]
MNAYPFDMNVIETKLSKRDRILEAAAAILCQDGFAGASIDAVATRANVSRQTIYNHVGDKEGLFKAVIKELAERSTEHFFEMLEEFPDIDNSDDSLQSGLSAFGTRILYHMTHDKTARWLMRLVQNEGERYPELLSGWREYGPGRKNPALAAKFASLAHAGVIRREDPTLTARQFMALLTAEWRPETQLGHLPDEETCRAMAERGVRAFVAAYAIK